QKGRWLMCNREPQQVADLARRYDHGDPGSEAYSDRKRDVFDVRPGTQQPDGNENQPRDDGCKGETVIAMPFNHAGDEADEGAGRSSNLKATPADKGNNENTHNSRREADTTQKRQRDNGNCEAGDCTGPQVWPAVTFTENRDQLRRE